MAGSDIKPFQRGEPTRNVLSASRLNELADACQKINSLVGDGLIQVVHGPRGISLRLDVRQLIPNLPKIPPATSAAALAWTNASALHETWVYPATSDLYVFGAINGTAGFIGTDECDGTCTASVCTTNTFTAPQTVTPSTNNNTVIGGESTGGVLAVTQNTTQPAATWSNAGGVQATITSTGQYSFATHTGVAAIAFTAGTAGNADRAAQRTELGIGGAGTAALTTTVGDPGSDSNVPTEAAVRTAINAATGAGTQALTLDTGTISAGQLFVAVGTTGIVQSAGSTLAELDAAYRNGTEVCTLATGTISAGEIIAAAGTTGEMVTTGSTLAQILAGATGGGSYSHIDALMDMGITGMV